MEFVLTQLAGFGGALSVLVLDPLTYAYLMLSVECVAYFLNMLKFPIAPLVIGVILGGLFDETFRRSQLISAGDLSVFATRPVAAFLLVLNLTRVASQIRVAKRLFSKLFKGTR